MAATASKSTDDLSLRPVELLTAPAIARRVDDVGAVHLLEAVDELGRQLRLERRAVAVSDAPGSTTPGPA